MAKSSMMRFESMPRLADAVATAGTPEWDAAFDNLFANEQDILS